MELCSDSEMFPDVEGKSANRQFFADADSPHLPFTPIVCRRGVYVSRAAQRLSGRSAEA